ncbi:MAG: hypothetical protein ACYC0F_20350, partial [Rhodanobacter sp.]
FTQGLGVLDAVSPVRDFAQQLPGGTTVYGQQDRRGRKAVLATEKATVGDFYNVVRPDGTILKTAVPETSLTSTMSSLSEQYPDAQPVKLGTKPLGSGANDDSKTQWERQKALFIAGEKKIAEGIPMSGQERASWSGAGQFIANKQVVTDAQGHVYTQEGLDLGQLREQVRGSGKTRGGDALDIPLPRSMEPKQVGTVAVNTAEAGKQSAIKVATSELDNNVLPRLYNQDGSVNRQTVLGMQKIGPVEGVPGTEGRIARQAMKRSIEVKVRTDSGAAVPESEVSRYMDMYSPSVFDSDISIKEKQQALSDYFNGVTTLTQFKSGAGLSKETLDANEAAKKATGSKPAGSFYNPHTPTSEADMTDGKVPFGSWFINPADGKPYQRKRRKE